MGGQLRWVWGWVCVGWGDGEKGVGDMDVGCGGWAGWVVMLGTVRMRWVLGSGVRFGWNYLVQFNFYCKIYSCTYCITKQGHSP